MGYSQVKENNQRKSNKKGFSLPITTSKPKMPPVKPPKKENNKK